MKVLLKEDVDKLGMAGDILNVADGYARNFLIPKGLAVKATAGQVKQVDTIKRQAQAKRDRITAELEALTGKLDGLQVQFEAAASDKGRLYGSVTTEMIALAIEKEIGDEVDKRKIESDPLRQLGLHNIPVRLSAEFIPNVIVIVHREGEDPADYLKTEPVEEVAESVEEVAEPVEEIAEPVAEVAEPVEEAESVTLEGEQVETAVTEEEEAEETPDIEQD